jgi:hypothetical protein
MSQKWSVLGASSVVGASLIGAGLMFLLDPANGPRRRTAIRDRMTRTMRRSRDFSMKAARDIRHRAKGLAHEVRAKQQDDGVDRSASDRVLHDRVRSRMGHAIEHPGAVEVIARDGNITLTGSLLREEADRLLSIVTGIPGVHHVDNQLQAMPYAYGVTSLQGGRSHHRLRQAIGRLDSTAGRIVVGSLGAFIAAALGIQRIQRLRHRNGDSMPLGRPIAAEIVP